MKVLVIDDDNSTRRLLTKSLDESGFQTFVVESGEAAMQILSKTDSPLLVILGWESSDFNGLEFCQKVRKEIFGKSVYLLIQVPLFGTADSFDVLNSGADDFVNIPINLFELRARIKNAERIIALEQNRINLETKLENASLAIDKTENSQNLPETSTRKLSETTNCEFDEYKNLFNLANDSIIIFDPKTEIVLDVNDRACYSYRISREKFIGSSLEKIAVDRQHDLQLIETLSEKGVIEGFETSHLRGDGETMNVLINSSIVEFNGRRAVLSINRDVTESHKSEFLIKRAKHEWSNTVDSISDLIIITDDSGKIRRCNAAACGFFDSSYAEIIGQPLDKLLISNAESKIHDFTLNALRTNIWEGRLGKLQDWFEITNNKVSFADGQGWVHIIKNTTARKQAEKTFRRLITAIEQAADGIVILNENGIIEFVNPAFEKTLQSSSKDIVGKHFFGMKSRFQRKTDNDVDFPKIAKGEIWHGVYKATRKNGDVYDEETTISPVTDSDGNLLNFVAVCRDVSEKKRMESIAEAVNMMENVGLIFSGIRHELGNPINSIKVALTVLGKNLQSWENEQISTYIERCLSETTRVEYLLNSLKTFSMHENPKMKPVNLTDFTKNFIALVENDFDRRGVKINLVNENINSVASCDSRALHQIMLNLLANSADALENVENAQIHIIISENHKRININIEDNGAGMNEVQLNNLFKPFYTSKPHGTGLGLVIVKKMIVKMNGSIAISSVSDVGTTVVLTLESHAV